MSGINNNDADYNDEGLVSDIITGGGIQGALTVGTSAIEVKVSTSRLTNRKSLTLHNNSSVTIYWGYTNAVSTTTGTPIYANQIATWAISDTQAIFAIAGTASNNTRITEGA